MEIINKTIQLNTQKEFDFIDLTDKAEEFFKESRIQNGLMNIQTMHTTAALILNENEPLLMEDFKNHLAQLSPKDLCYSHNDFTVRTVNICDGECRNGHSHCLALHFPSNLTLNIINGKLQLGQWQRIFVLELDKPRERKIQIQIIGR